MHSYTTFNRRLARQYDRWMVAMHYAKHTQHTYSRVIRQYVEFVGKRSIAAARHTDIREFIARISEDGASLGAVYRDLSVLRLFYDFLNLGGVVSYVPARFLRLRMPYSNTPRSLSEAQVQRLILATRTLRERALVEFLYATGCRLGETVRINVEDLDLGTRTAQIRGKLGKVRIVLLTQNAADALRAYVGTRKGGFVFQQDRPVQKGCLTVQDGKWMSKWVEYSGSDGKRARRHKWLGRVGQLSYESAKKQHEELIAGLQLIRPLRNSPLSKMAVQQVVRQIAHRAGVKGVTPHTFRRTFATHLYDHGAGVEVIKALMGHVWIQMTMIYAQIGPDRLAKTFERCHPRGSLNVEIPE